MSELALITVPVTEWKGVQKNLADISKTLLEIKTKGQNENLTHKEVQQLLKCSRNTVNSYVERGYFNQYQNGKYSKVIFKRAEIEYFMQNR